MIPPADFEYVIKKGIADEEQRIIEGFATVQVPDKDNPPDIIEVESVAKTFNEFMGSTLQATKKFQNLKRGKYITG